MRHCRSLERLGLSPADLHTNLSVRNALRWSLRRIPLVLFPVIIIGLTGWALWWPPYRVTGLVVDRLAPSRDVKASYRFFGGLVFYFLWLALLVIAAAVWVDGVTAVLVGVGAPAVGLAGLWIREHWRAAWLDARRWFLLRGRRSLLRDLGRRQWEIAERFDALLHSSTRSSSPDPVLR